MDRWQGMVLQLPASTHCRLIGLWIHVFRAAHYLPHFSPLFARCHNGLRQTFMFVRVRDVRFPAVYKYPTLPFLLPAVDLSIDCHRSIKHVFASKFRP